MRIYAHATAARDADAADILAKVSSPRPDRLKQSPPPYGACPLVRVYFPKSLRRRYRWFMAIAPPAAAAHS